MRMIHSVVIREKPPSKRPRKRSRARFYVNIANFKYQTYLDTLTVKKFQQNLTRLQVSSHKLEVECGRWTRPERTPLDNRKCKMCNILEGSSILYLNVHFTEILESS